LKISFISLPNFCALYGNRKHNSNVASSLELCNRSTTVSKA
jgi:hypothetical protein